jgi:SWI/SNF-related matrix-associated actin-dependent regulator of chromatin subfamily A member 5
MVKEDRSDWVAVEPEHARKSDDLPAVRPAQTAYQYFQKANWDLIKQQQSQRGEPTDLAHLTKLVSTTWREMSQEDRQIYEDKAAEDHERFTKESILRDNAFRERQERLRQEREELIITEGDGHATRRARKKELKKAAKLERKRSNDRLKKQKYRQIDNSDEDEFKSDDGGFSSGNSFNSEGLSSSSSDSDDSNAPKTKKKVTVVSEAVLAKRKQARLEKEAKEKYIAERQDHLRNERAEQAKKRLDFLLKQSDIFRHFGEVKEDKQKFYSNRVKVSESPSKSSRRDTVLEDEDKDLAEADQHAASYLRSQPTTLGFGKMRPYQLEGLNWMIGLQEHGVNGILADEMGM